MELQGLVLFIAAITWSVLSGASVNSIPVQQQQQQQQQPTLCSSFSSGLEVESRYSDVGDQKWANQCPERHQTTALWLNTIQNMVEDVKCCPGNVDHALSHPVLDFHYYDKGVADPLKPWQIECKPNHVVTALHLSENVENGYSKHINAMKCSLLVDAIINTVKCVQIDNFNLIGGTRLPNETWSAQCPNSMAVVALFDNNGFKSVEYSKCCLVEDRLPTLPWHCDFSGGDLCGWTQDIGDDVDWKHKDNGGGYHYISLDISSPGGVARISSPGYSPRSEGVCLRIYYFMSGYRPRIDVLLRYTMPGTHAQNITTVRSIVCPLARPKTEDIRILTTGNFQIIIEGEKNLEHVSMINIIDLKLIALDDCKVDACSPPSTGCGPNAHCLPINGYLRCTCKKGFHVVNEGCRSINPPVTNPYTPIISTKPSTVHTVSTGNKNGNGNGGKNGVSGEITPRPETKPNKPGGGKGVPNTGTKFDRPSSGNKITTWMFTGFGGLGGVLLTGCAICLLFVYRRRLLATKRRVCFDMELRHHRNLTPDASTKRNHDATALLPIPENKAVSSWKCRSFRSPSLGSASSFVESSLVNAALSQNHHYFEVEPSIDDLKRKISIDTLMSPAYGGTVELEGIIANDSDLFFEPPSDEMALRAQLKRELPRTSIRINSDKTLGEGAFGYVKLGTWKKRCGNLVKVAVKMLKEPASSQDKVMFFREAVIMSQFVHTNVVYMYGVMTTEYPPMIVLEYMSHGNLKKFLVQQNKMSRGSCSVIARDQHLVFLRFARDIVAGMTYLSNLKFIHRDLAARNILLNANLTCKIGDFGLARDLIDSDHYTAKERTFPVKWTAPEAMLHNRYSSASDVWSFGIVLYEIWSLGRKPYKDFDNKTVTDLVCNRGFRLPPPRACPRIIYHIMIDCWHPKAEKRPVFSQLKYCLDKGDARLLGKEDARPRSTTYSNLSGTTADKEDVYGDLQFTYYCRTE